MGKVLITGGRGLIGTALTARLLQEGYAVHHLGRGMAPASGVPAHRWDVRTGYLDPHALEGVNHVIHLSGADIADGRWTRARRHELHASRVAAAHLLRREAERTGTWPRTFISASGVNYYGTRTTDHVHTEDEPAADDFLGRLCRDWEQAADAWAPHCRVVKLRTPVVLAREGGAFPKMLAPARRGMAAPLGSGRQWMPWVHIEDLVRAYLHALRTGSLSGAYNVVATQAIGNRQFMHEVAKVLHRPFFLPGVPALLLRAVLGGPAELVLHGSRASNAKLLGSGFTFNYPQARPALEQLLG